MEGYCSFGARCQFIHKADRKEEANLYANALYGRVSRLWQLKVKSPDISMHDLVCQSTNSEDVLLRSLPIMRNNWDLNVPNELSHDPKTKETFP